MEPYRRELQVHCYGVLGSLADAEDLLQETLLAAWRGLDGFEERESLRTWLYRIATNRFLNCLRSGSRRPQAEAPALPARPPDPTRLGECRGGSRTRTLSSTRRCEAGPETRYESREAMCVAFITALQLLPPRQRAILVLRDVLGFRAAEAAGLLETTEESVTSGLKRARATLAHKPPNERRPPAPHSPEERRVLDRLVGAFERGDVDALVSLMTDDVWVRMPPIPLEYRGRALTGRFFAAVAFRDGRRYHLVPTRTGGQPAFGVYIDDAASGVARVFGLLVITLAGDEVSVITRFENARDPRLRAAPDAGRA